MTESEPVYDRWGARIPDTVLNSVGYRVAQKIAAGTPRRDVTTNKPLPFEQQPEAVQAANPHLAPPPPPPPTPLTSRETQVATAADMLGIPQDVLLDSASLMRQVDALEDSDAEGIRSAIVDHLVANPRLVAPRPTMQPNPAQGSSAMPAPSSSSDGSLKSRMADKATALANGDATSTSGGIRRIL